MAQEPVDLLNGSLFLSVRKAFVSSDLLHLFAHHGPACDLAFPRFGWLGFAFFLGTVLGLALSLLF